MQFTQHQQGFKGSSFKANRMAAFNISKLPGIGVVSGTLGGAVNLAESAIYGVAALGGSVKKVGGLIKEVFYDHGLRDWELTDLASLGLGKLGKMASAGFKNLVDADRSFVRHLVNEALTTGGYAGLSTARPMVGLVAGDQMGDVVPLQQGLRRLLGKANAGIGNMLSSAGPAANNNKEAPVAKAA